MPTTGTSLVTQFTIEALGYTSVNIPLTYRYYYYMSWADYMEEIINPNNIKRNPLTEWVYGNTLTTLLPTGRGNNT